MVAVTVTMGLRLRATTSITGMEEVTPEDTATGMADHRDMEAMGIGNNGSNTGHRLMGIRAMDSAEYRTSRHRGLLLDYVRSMIDADDAHDDGIMMRIT
mmetsp:Transcript_27416/g.53214  ORF Transcript_27416/g.53214 Transcript_27416/m.53214 type:complete len:99 (+) Transcript_27416:1326-1622(+)